MVIAGETYSPGWQATVDGRRVRIYEAYSALRGVVVDAGRHRIEMRYRPKSVLLGSLLTSASRLIPGSQLTSLGIAGAVVLRILAI